MLVVESAQNLTIGTVVASLALRIQIQRYLAVLPFHTVSAARLIEPRSRSALAYMGIIALLRSVECVTYIAQL